jgi:hypothetical protein
LEEQEALTAAALLFGHFGLEGGHEFVFEGGGDGLGFAAFVDLDGLLRGVEDNPAVGAFFDVLVEFFFGGGVESGLEIVAELA